MPLVDTTHQASQQVRALPDGYPAYLAYTCSPQDPLMPPFVLALSAVTLSQPQQRAECLGAGKLYSSHSAIVVTGTN